MIVSRRSLITAASWSLFSPAIGWAKTQQDVLQEFDSFLKESTENDPAAVLEAAQEREGMQSFFASQLARPLKGRPKLATRKISDLAVKLLTGFEVSSQKYYEKYLRNPILPGGESGITFGIGYDLGYCKPKWLDEDWAQFTELSKHEIDLLKSVCGMTGSAAKVALQSVKEVDIPWATAFEQFQTITLPRYITETLEALPNADALGDNSLGALVSLTYNRGASYETPGQRYTEMRNIRVHLVDGEPKKIPDEITHMKYLWSGNNALRGLLVRRDAEAKLFDLDFI